jgi:signal transduction histidine kinase
MRKTNPLGTGSSPLVIAAIIIVAALLLISTFEFFSFSTANVQRSAVDATNSNAQIEASDMAKILGGKLSAISNNLKILSMTPIVQKLNATQAQTVLVAAQNTTSESTSAYSLIDSKGTLLASSNRSNDQTAQGQNLSQRSWYVGAKASGTIYTDPEFFSITSNQTFIVVSQPVYSLVSSSGVSSKKFVGVLASGVSFAKLGAVVKKQLPLQVQGSLGIVDYKGTILYGNSPQSLGKNLFSNEIRALLPAAISASFYSFVNDSLSGSPALRDFDYQGLTTALASQPVTYGDVLGNPTDQRLFAVVYVTAPSALAAGQVAQVGQLQTFTGLSSAAILAVAAIGAVSVIRRNRTLSELVKKRTASLERSTKSAELMQDILSHDIRNYNQISQMSLELIRDGLSKNDDASRAQAVKLVDSGLKAVEGSTLLVSRAKLLGSIISQPDTQLHPVDLEASLRRSAELVVSANPRKKVDTSFNTGSRAQVQADELLDEAFTNILSNSVNYTETDVVPVEIAVEQATITSGGTPSAGWKITFTDHGRGIPDEMKKDLFTRYLRTSQGTGLGLSIVYVLVVDRYSGSLKVTDRVEGDPSQGTKIEVWLPEAK